ncbi:DUF4263 domain-containing protein [Candidatus Woesearchaeota archaeon]|nr:DUF4263 domain-containing protein [Candidatus Woesearchaeota archaeon]
MPIHFHVFGALAILSYTSEQDSYIMRLHQEFIHTDAEKEISITRIYTFSQLQYLTRDNCKNLVEGVENESNVLLKELFSDYSISFKVANLVNGYYKFIPSVVGGIELFISKDIQLKDKIFRASRDISIMLKIVQLGYDYLYIGGDHENAIVWDTYKELLKRFPTSTELTRYSGKRISEVLHEFFPSSVDWEEKYRRYMSRRETNTAMLENQFLQDLDLNTTVMQEKKKLIRLRTTLENMLSSSLRFKEKEWQSMIFEILRLLFPKYCKVFKEFRIQNPSNARSHFRSDFVMADYDGFIDIVEIKIPEISCMSSTRKYRNNYFPTKELSGTIIQVENYIYSLTYWGKNGELAINKKYQNELPPGVALRTVSPRGIIIMGRNSDFNTDKLKLDFELIKKQYRNIIDILTYDDLLRRLTTLINAY